MRIVLFDAILERHTSASLRRALQARGHTVTWTGALWPGQRLPQAADDLERLWAQVHAVARDRPDVVLNMRASSLQPEMVAHLKSAGAQTLVWLADEPVLYQVCYRHVVAAYDIRLHCGPADVLAFYQQRHGGLGVNFPFWTDAEAFPYCYRPGQAELDLVFLGNCHDAVRSRRYDLLSSLPFRTRIYGKLRQDPFKLHAGYVEHTHETAAVLARARVGVNIPQLFQDYAGSEHDFPELAGFSHFEFPSRVIQYAACGLPILSLEPRGAPRTFPELVAGRERDELVAKAEALLADEDRLRALSAAVHARFERSFSAAARAALLENLVAAPAEWQALDLAVRAERFATLLPEECGPAAPRVRSAARGGSHPAVPALDEQRAQLRTTVLESPRKWRILCLAAPADEEAAARHRALVQLGHTVLVSDPAEHEALSAAAPASPGVVRLRALEPLLERFAPQIIVCSGLCFSAVDSRTLRAPGVLLLGIFPAALARAVVAGDFDYVATPSVVALETWRNAGANNALRMPPGADRAALLAEIEPDPALAADVACFQPATGHPERQAVLETLAREFNVRAYGSGWTLPGSEPVHGARRVQAGRATRAHVVFGDDYLTEALEAVASGAVLCLPGGAETKFPFEPGSEAIGYATGADLLASLREILDDSAGREQLCRAAFQRLAHGHLWEQRWLELLAAIERDVAEQPTMVSAERGAQLRMTLSQERPRPRRVVISGFYGAQNTGDELILRAITEGVHRTQPDVQFVVASEESAAVQRLHGCAAFPRKDHAAGQAEVAAAAAVVLGGGGLWHDYTFLRAGDLPGLFSDTVLSLAGFAKLPLLARMYGRPFHVFGVGAGPLRPHNAQRFLRFLGEQAQSITVRDAASAALLARIPGWRTPIACAPDAVYALDLGTPAAPPPVAELRQQCRFIAVNLRPWPGASAVRLYERVARALEQVCRRNDCALVGLPLQPGEHDALVLARVFAMIRIPRPAVVLNWTSRFEELFGTLQASTGVLAMRLHACLLAHRLGVPTLGIHYDPKVRQHFAELHRIDCSLPVDAPPAELVARLEALLALEGRLPAATARRVQDLESAARDALQQLAQRLADTPPVSEIVPLMLRAAPVLAPPAKAAEDEPDNEFDEPLARLDRGTLQGGSLSGSKTPVRIVSHRQPYRLWFRLERSDPRRGDFAGFSLPIAHPGGGGHTALIRVRSPYQRPENKGRLAYQILLNGQLLLEEDISLWGETNHVRIHWQSAEPASAIAVRVVALRNCEPWNWGLVGRIVIAGITHSPYPWTGPPHVLATSPFSHLVPPGGASAEA